MKNPLKSPSKRLQKKSSPKGRSKKKGDHSYTHIPVPFEHQQRWKKTNAQSKTIAETGGAKLGSKEITEDDFKNGVPHNKEIWAMYQSDHHHLSRYLKGEMAVCINEVSKARHLLNKIKADPEKHIHEPIIRLEKMEEKELDNLNNLYRPKKEELENAINATKEEIKTCKEERKELSEEIGTKRSLKKITLMGAMFYIGSIFIFGGEIASNYSSLMITGDPWYLVLSLALAISVAMFLAAKFGGHFLKSIAKNKKHSYSK